MVYSVEHQLSLPDFGLPEVTAIVTKERGEAPLFLSQSRAENVAECLDHPDRLNDYVYESVGERYYQAIFGIAYHRLVQTLDLWRLTIRSLPYESRDFRNDYLRSLYDTLPYAVPTSGRESRLFAELLNDWKLAIPRRGLHRESSYGMLMNIYQVIADKVNGLVESSSEFVHEEAMNGFEMSGPGPESNHLAFMSGSDIRRLWGEYGGLQALMESAGDILDFHFSKLINQFDYGRGYVSEVRLSGYLRDLHTVWSGRLDSLIRVTDNEGRRRIRIIDHKSGKPYFKSTDTWIGVARMYSVWLNGLMAASAPDTFDMQGKVAQLGSFLAPIDYSDHIEYYYVGRGDQGLEVVDVGGILEYAWRPEGFYAMREGMLQFVGAIREHQGWLSPILAPVNQIREESYHGW